MTRWSLFLQTLSLLHHFLGLYSVRMGTGVDTRVDEQGKANGPGQIPIDGDEGGVR
jgi:hypothetical protein